MPRILEIDIETFSSAPLPKCGVYRYVDAPDFEILLFSYAYGDGPVQTVDLACGERLPADVLMALDDPVYLKYAYNAAFERVCLSRYLGRWLDPAQWRCSTVMASYLTLPSRLGDVAVALNLTEKKMEEGKDLIRYFSIPCKPKGGRAQASAGVSAACGANGTPGAIGAHGADSTNGGRTRNLPEHAPDKWAIYKSYNAQDVETERAVRKALEAHPLPEHEWALYALDQCINDRGVRVDKLLVKQAMRVDQVFSAQAFLRAKLLTGLENPGSVSQLKAWLADQDMPMESLAKKIVQEKAKDAEGVVGELLNLRLELSKTSVKKYEAMARYICRDGRVHGMTQFYGAARTGRWCLTGDHEVLTPAGWLRLDEWKGGWIACWNSETEAISFQEANALCFPYTGPTYHYIDQRIDQISTPDHKMRFQRRRCGDWVTDTVQAMSTCRPCIPIYGYSVKTAPSNAKNLRVLVMVQADGTYTKDGILQLRFRKQRKIERCKKLLREAGIEFTCAQFDNATRFSVPARKLPLWLRMFADKTFGAWLFDENPDVFFDELANWDGCRETQNSFQYCTCNRQNADFVQAFAHMSGRSAVILKKERSSEHRAWTDTYYVDICENLLNTHEIRTKPTIEAYEGTVYCAETRTGFFLVRRNGKVWVTGNSGRGIQLQNLPQNHLPDLSLAREIVKAGDEELLELLFGSVPGTLSELIRTALIPKDGCRFIVADFSAIEARVLAWLAGEEWVLEEFRGRGKIYEATAARMFSVPAETIVKGNPNYEYRQKGKQATLSCIAEGQLVLTDRGLVPIEKITLSHRVWDGEAFVEHDGVVYQGERSVICYDGVTATPDHHVWIEGQSQPVQLGIAAACDAHLAVTEHCGQAIRLGQDHQFGETMECDVEPLLCPDRMHILSQRSVDAPWQLDSRDIEGVSELLGKAKTDTHVVGSATDCCQATMREPERSTVPPLWRKRNQIQLSICDQSRHLDFGKHSKCAQGLRDGSNRQQRQLRAGKHSLCFSFDQFWESTANRALRVGSRILALLPKCRYPYAFGGKDARGDHRVGKTGCARKKKGLEDNKRTARLYDIRNAGSHHRFTVSGHLVHNCGYGGGVGALKAMNAKMPEKEMQPLVDAWRAANPHIVAFWGALDRAARDVIEEHTSARVGKVTLFWKDDRMFIQLPGGRRLCYISPRFVPNRFGNSGIGYLAPAANGQMILQETFGGKLAENCTQSIARDLLAHGMMNLEAAGYSIVFHVHDEAVMEVPVGQGSVEEACGVMARAPEWAEGLPLRADGEELPYYRK